MELPIHDAGWRCPALFTQAEKVRLAETIYDQPKTPSFQTQALFKGLRLKKTLDIGEYMSHERDIW
ncbi:hypothetical protein AA0473_1111 [Acetobacter orleanensis NRIC 0473]|uniref:Uncharacterized protein n=1 Tax=Acetobacter orleanensis TaxID=104099 RepID=A0A4Y3TIH2_9PROT|nr:hypothetical protein Abol_003_151 [Acetobacter orleanensis JCM 7639]GBR26314.1 hypothetical protein AA0473_1111 [Acetobacter orleanensis NRIC 0473]GEB81762.1 hypothetical protein AOR01nite_02390 [Acetobacter orleanensis]